VTTASSVIDYDKYADEENNLVYSYPGGAANYYAPAYTESEITYIPTKKTSTMRNSVAGLDYISFFPNSLDNVTFSGGGSLLPLKNLYGAGYKEYDVITEAGDTVKQPYYAHGFQYCSPKPMSPLYVEEVLCWSKDIAGLDNPLNGNTLTLCIYDRAGSASEPVFVLTCTPDQCVKDRDGYHLLHFTQKQEDPISGEMVDAPFMLDFSAKMEFTGFDQDGVTANVMGVRFPEEFRSEDADILKSYCLLEDNKRISYTNLVAAVFFYGFFDKVDVWDVMEVDTLGNTAHVNGMLVTADGETCKNVYYAGNKGAFVETALDWFVKDTEGLPTGEENYWSDDAYEIGWVQNVVCTELLRTSGTLMCYEVAVTCDPLPDGVEKRHAIMHVVGMGATSPDIHIFQGAYTSEEMEEILSVEAVAADKKVTNAFSNITYNIAGQ
ncbi:MAG: hypothetical protein HUK03_08965, partial [Bacteroidaceae bacterium]|nr:hypothetical protein [Bacteroidaceae bacterium]